MTEFQFDITQDDLSDFQAAGPVFVTFGETMLRDTPADNQRPEFTRLAHLSMAGSELTLAMTLARLGIPASYITRVPDNPYGWMLRNTARASGISCDHFVWAPKAEPFGRFIYEIGRTPRRNVGWYQRMYSAASRLGPGDVDWVSALQDCRLFHTSGISFGLAPHSGYEKNPLLGAFQEAMQAKPESCLVGCDFNYRSTLWGPELCAEVMTPILRDHVDILITTIEDMAKLYGIGCGRYSAEDIVKGDFSDLQDDDLLAFTDEVRDRFATRVVALTIRHPQSFEEHLWEAAAADDAGAFFRSASPRPMTLWDRLGGGDTWNGGFYYGLLTEGIGSVGLQKGVLVGDAATRIKQTLMFDLPIINPAEVQALMKSDVHGGGKRTER